MSLDDRHSAEMQKNGGTLKCQWVATAADHNKWESLGTAWSWRSECSSSRGPQRSWRGVWSEEAFGNDGILFLKPCQ